MTGQNDQVVYFLLVDDRDENLIALETLLRRDGLSLLKAKSGIEALELLLQHDVALALIDVQMPEMDGFELAEMMRGSERTRRVPIIFLTAGSADQQRRFRGYETGAVDFLQKPIEPDILRGKASVFFELYCQRREVARQRDKLAAMIEENSLLLEESRRYARALQDADRRKDEFLATLAHELRNPLAPILSAIQVLRITATMQSSAANTAEVCEIVERQAQHLVRLVDDLLEVSRITNGKIEIEQKRIDLNDAIRNAVETSRPLIERGRHKLTVESAPAPLTVRGDLVRLTQVFANLLINAAKYTPEQGTILLKAERCKEWAEVRVIDSGLGIPVEMVEHVFEMFTQIDRHLNRSRGGMGIGLTLVKRLVELHGGTVAAFSEGEGRGAEFLIRLPILELEADTDVPETVPNPISVGKRKILIIDDNSDAVSSLQLLLATAGHHVSAANDGPTGIEQVESFQPDAILLDLGMPGMDGYETATRIREIPAGRQALLVALTAWSHEETRARAREAGFDLHVVKPVTASTIEDILRIRRSELKQNV